MRLKLWAAIGLLTLGACAAPKHYDPQSVAHTAWIHTRSGGTFQVERRVADWIVLQKKAHANPKDKAVLAFPEIHGEVVKVPVGAISAVIANK